MVVSLDPLGHVGKPVDSDLQLQMLRSGPMPFLMLCSKLPSELSSCRSTGWEIQANLSRSRANMSDKLWRWFCHTYSSSTNYSRAPSIWILVVHHQNVFMYVHTHRILVKDVVLSSFDERDSLEHSSYEIAGSSPKVSRPVSLATKHICGNQGTVTCAVEDAPDLWNSFQRKPFLNDAPR